MTYNEVLREVFRNAIIPYMLFFGKKNKRKFEILWGVISLLTIASMILLYMPTVFR